MKRRNVFAWFFGAAALQAQTPRLGWQNGKATPDQCPVCGTMAGPNPLVPPPPATATKKGKGAPTMKHLTECMKCKNAFWQH